MWQSFYRFISNIIFPRWCVSCHQPGQYLCLKCTQQITQKELICPQCAKPAIFGQTHPICLRPQSLDGLWTYGSYSPPLKQLLQKLKYQGVYDLVEELVDLVIAYWIKYPPQFLELLKNDFNQGWTLVPVPLHSKRQKERGFNQAEIIAKVISQKIGVNYKSVLVKTKNTHSQAHLDRAKRLTNLKGAFELSADIKSSSGNYILIDDVWTTGTTLRECAKILKRSGAKQVWGLTVAR